MTWLTYVQQIWLKILPYWNIGTRWENSRISKISFLYILAQIFLFGVNLPKLNHQSSIQALSEYIYNIVFTLTEPDTVRPPYQAAKLHKTQVFV